MATDRELRDAIRSFVVPVKAALSGRPPPQARFDLRATAGEAHKLLDPAQPGVPAYDRLKALVDAVLRNASDADVGDAMNAGRDLIDGPL